MDGSPALLVSALASFCAVAMISLAGLRAWHGWVALRREQLLSRRPGGGIDLDALRTRVKRLEAIASGLDG
jgi:hypothetical protein